MSVINALNRRFRNYRARHIAKNQHCGFQAKSGELVVTTFYDVEGDYAVQGMNDPCFSALEKIAQVEQDCGIHSTYNVVARFAQEAPALFLDIEKNGHEIASHSLDHRVLTTLSMTEQNYSIVEAKRVFDEIGLSVIGHRSPQSSWNFSIVKQLNEAGYLWNAENDPNRVPYVIKNKSQSKQALWRMPVTMDDWWYEGDGLSADVVLARWQDKIIEEQKHGGCISIGFHPWVEFPGERFEAFESFMKWLSSRDGVTTMPFKKLMLSANTY